jgi:rod shape determining protein RodA
MVWMNRVPIRQIALLALGAVLIGVIAFPFLQPYQQARVINFAIPDPNARTGATYNVTQALIAIGSGGLFGKGYGHGTQTQLRFMKVRHTDFIFSATAEEFGIVGAIMIVIIEAFVIYRAIRAAQKAKDVSGAMIAFGVAMLLFFQSAANIAVNLRLIPVSGLPLPFISYGGSGLMALMIGVGLVESVVMRHRELEF